MQHRVSLVMAAVLLCGLLFGCGGAPVGTLSGNDQIQVAFVPADDNQKPYWRDMGEVDYPTEYVDGYDYGNATVDAVCKIVDGQLVVDISGSGLKPNFAYQLKLEGDPGTPTSAVLASLGRTWQDIGYLIYGFVVTDKDGNISGAASGDIVTSGGPSFSVPVDSSYHVLWRRSDRRAKRNDGPTLSHTVVRGETAYGISPEEEENKPVKVYAEWEPSRPTPGSLVLPDGDYACRLRLTEESWHDTGDGWASMWDGWKSVLEAPLEWTIGSSPPPPSETGGIAGKVVDGGQGASGALVEIFGPDDSNLSAGTDTTDNEGQFGFSGLLVGDYDITVNGGFAKSVTVTAGETVDAGKIQLP